ncbi:VENN motif pre-toxin domain-containing protein, partial [Chromobacterium sinusclupearum]|uniref:VENN motif pre-toxin domain-containing protein n=1 Tax=Chromobacterium sinusclupearum TaxID=2077146 RepID=UPI0018EB9CDA
DKMTAEEKLQRENLVSGLLAGVAAGTGGASTAATVVDAAKTEMENNFLGKKATKTRDKALDVLKDNQGLIGWLKGKGDPNHAAEVVLSANDLDQRSDYLLQKYRNNPNSLSAGETQELAVYLGDYRLSYGDVAVASLVKNGSGPRLDRGDLAELTGYAQGLVSLKDQHDWQALVGTPALFTLPGGIGVAARSIAAAQSATEFGEGVKQLTTGDADGLYKLGMPILNAAAEGAYGLLNSQRAGGGSYNVRPMSGVLDKVGEVVDASQQGRGAANSGSAGISTSATAGDTALTGPVHSTAGASRAAANSGNWASGSLSQTVKNLVGDSPEITFTQSGKTIYSNPKTGISVVYDNSGNYYRIQNSAGQYLDQSGNAMPNNVPLIKPNKTSQTGVPSDVKNALTHFNNVDGE